LKWAQPELFAAPAVVPTDATRGVEVARVFPQAGSGAEAEEPALAAVATTAYPHPTLVRYSYQLPSDGARALVNAISAARTGFRGTDLGFGYEIPKTPAGVGRSLL